MRDAGGSAWTWLRSTGRIRECAQFSFANTSEDRKQLIADNQEAFLYGTTEEFGMRDEHFEENGQAISHGTIGASRRVLFARPERSPYSRTWTRNARFVLSVTAMAMRV